jgi:hypothetical protein
VRVLTGLRPVSICFLHILSGACPHAPGFRIGTLISQALTPYDIDS